MILFLLHKLILLFLLLLNCTFDHNHYKDRVPQKLQKTQRQTFQQGRGNLLHTLGYNSYSQQSIKVQDRYPQRFL